MKKFLWILPLLVIMLSSCAKDEIVPTSDAVQYSASSELEIYLVNSAGYPYVTMYALDGNTPVYISVSSFNVNGTNYRVPIFGSSIATKHFWFDARFVDSSPWTVTATAEGKTGTITLQLRNGLIEVI